ncbi:MAG: hypothetical protein K2X27_09385, partial [Candidatus Obscuribacterales bacterium]|nr:hypothetical protein [Candidatus Obscuribacterales bacterium]
KDTEYAVSFLARGKASNVYFPDLDANGLPANLPPGVNLSTSDLVSKDVGGTKKFLVGYQSITSAAGIPGCPTTWAVPLRPGEQPHLVGVNDFDANKTAPFTPTVPNAFKSGAEAAFARTQSNVGMRSCAVVGVLNRTFPIQQSGGTIIIDNAGTNVAATTINDPGNSIYADPTKMMNPAGVEIFSVTAKNHFPSGEKTRQYMIHSSDGDYPSEAIKAQAQSTDNSSVPGSPPADQARTYPGNNLPDGIDLWAMKMHGQALYHSQYQERCTIMGTTLGTGQPAGAGPATQIQHVAFCNNKSFDGGGGSASPPECGNTPAFAALCNGQIGVPSGSTGTTTYNNLMPLEQYILAIQGGFGGGAGCVMVPALGPVGGCGSSIVGSGMKNLTGGPPFPQGTLSQLLSQTGTPSSVTDDLKARMRQIAPGSNPNTILGQTVTYNKILYIQNVGGSLVMTDQKPSSLQYDYESQAASLRPIVSAPANIPDGNTVAGRATRQVRGTWISGSMWECGTGAATGLSASVSRWTPSSGKGGLLGVLRFANCPEANGDDWCCP